jgi:hypothetical protein
VQCDLPAVVGEAAHGRLGPDLARASREHLERLVGGDGRGLALQQGGSAHPQLREPRGYLRSRQQLTRRASSLQGALDVGHPRPERELRGRPPELPPGLRLEVTPQPAGVSRRGHVVRIRVAQPEDPAAALGPGSSVTDLRLLQHDDVAAAPEQDARGGEAEQAGADDRHVAHPGHHRADYREARSQRLAPPEGRSAA